MAVIKEYPSELLTEGCSFYVPWRINNVGWDEQNRMNPKDKIEYIKNL